MRYSSTLTVLFDISQQIGQKWIRQLVFPLSMTGFRLLTSCDILQGHVGLITMFWWTSLGSEICSLSWWSTVIIYTQVFVSTSSRFKNWVSFRCFMVAIPPVTLSFSNWSVRLSDGTHSPWRSHTQISQISWSNRQSWTLWGESMTQAVNHGRKLFKIIFS